MSFSAFPRNFIRIISECYVTNGSIFTINSAIHIVYSQRMNIRHSADRVLIVNPLKLKATAIKLELS